MSSASVNQVRQTRVDLVGDSMDKFDVTFTEITKEKADELMLPGSGVTGHSVVTHYNPHTRVLTSEISSKGTLEEKTKTDFEAYYTTKAAAEVKPK